MKTTSTIISKCSSWNEAEKALIKRGYRYLGGGALSNVYCRPGGKYVIKIGRDGERDGFRFWAAYARHNPAPWVPRIGRFRWAPDGSYYMVAIERLTDVVEHRRDTAAWKMFQVARAAFQGETIRREDVDARTFALARYMQEFRRVLNGRYSLDLHGANAMVDDKDNLYITDPIAWGAGDYMPGCL